MAGKVNIGVEKAVFCVTSCRTSEDNYVLQGAHLSCSFTVGNRSALKFLRFNLSAKTEVQKKPFWLFVFVQ